ncbi:MAG: hypothetical protein ACK506_15665 [Pirellula sp.]|jgi:hypothetical protein
MIFAKTFLFVFGFSVFFQADPRSRQDGSGAEAEAATVKGEVFFSTSFARPSPIDLGFVKPGSKLEIVVQLHNRSAEDFPVKEVFTECSCTSVKLNSLLIPAGGASEAVISLDVPKRGGRRNAKIVGFKKSESEIVEVQLEYNFQGAWFFVDNTWSTTVPRGQSSATISLPLVITPPVVPSDLKLSGTGDLASTSPKIVRDGENYSIELVVPTPTDRGFTLAGEVVMENLSGVGKETLPCFIGRQDKVVVSPKIVRFTKVKNNYEASAIIRIDKSAISKGQELGIAGAIDELPIEVEKEEVAHGLFRVKVRFPEKRFLDKESGRFSAPSSIFWQIGWGNEIAEFNSPLGF